jgi:hypothetical protein
MDKALIQNLQSSINFEDESIRKSLDLVKAVKNMN